jgi:hypothetical protein
MKEGIGAGASVQDGVDERENKIQTTQKNKRD